MKSRTQFYLALYALAAAMLLCSCATTTTTWTDGRSALVCTQISQLPTDYLGNLLAGKGSSVYADDLGSMIPLRKKSKTVRDSTLVVTTDHVVFFPGQYVTFGVAPRIPGHMKVWSINYQIDNERWGGVNIRGDCGDGPGSRFTLSNRGDGNHILIVRIQLVDCIVEEELSVFHEVQVPIFMGATDGQSRRAKWGF